MEKRSGKFLFVFIISLFPLIPVCATNYYVAPAPKGSDSNNGTESLPFRTILRGMNKLTTGDVLTVEEGTYTDIIGEPTGLDNSGATSWAQAITIKAREGKLVTLRPSGDFVFHFQSSKQIYIVVDGFTIDAINVKVDAVKIGYPTETNPTNISHHIWIKDCSISNAPLIGVLITKPDDNSYGGYNYLSNDDIFNNGLKCTSNPGFSWEHCHGIYAAADNNIIENSRLHGNTGLGLHSYSNDDPTTYHKIHHNIIRYSLAYDNGMLNGGFNGSPGIGLYSVFDSGLPHEAYGNIVWNNRRGITLRYGGNKSIVHDNIIYKNVGPSGSTDPGYPIDVDGINTTDSKSSSDGVYSNTYINADFPTPLPMADTKKPEVPGNAQAVSISPTQINLSWSAPIDNVGVRGYRIYPSYGGPPIALVTQVSYQLTGLNPSTSYGFYIDAFDDAGNYSARTPLINATTLSTNPPPGDSILPSNPTGLQGNAGSSTQINLSWTASTDNVGVIGYNIYRDNVATPVATVTGTSYQNTGLTPGTIYNYQVAAFDAAGNISGKSSSINVGTLAFTEYFVSPLGLDTNPGTLAQPFRSVKKGVSVLRRKDILTIEAGTYTDPIDEPVGLNNASATSWSDAITIRARPGSTVVLQPSSGNRIFAFIHATQSYIILDGLTLDARNVMYEAIKVTYSGQLNDTAHHIWVKNSVIRNSPTVGVLITMPGENLGAGPNIFTNVDVYGNGFQCQKLGADFPLSACHGIFIGADDVIVENSRIHENSGSGINVETGSFPLKNNVIRYNLLYGNGTTSNGDGIGSPGIALKSGPNQQAYGNIFWGNKHGVLNMGIIHENVFYKNEGLDGKGHPIDISGISTTDSNPNDSIYNNTYVNSAIPNPIPNIPSASAPPSIPFVDNSAPTVPGNVSGVAASASQINLSWVASTDNVAVKEYRIYRNSGGSPIATVTGTIFQNTGLSPSTAYSYQVDAVDAVGNSSEKSVPLLVATQANNLAPSTNAGPDLTVNLPAVAVLDGTIQDDKLPSNTITQIWSVVSGPGPVDFVDASAVDTTAKFNTGGLYVLRLTASDGLLSSNDTVTIMVNNPNQAPSVNAGADQTISITGFANLNGTVTDDNLPNKNLTVTWSKLSGPGAVSFGNVNLEDTTAQFFAAGTYVLQLLGNDGALTTSDTLTVVVAPVGSGNLAPSVDAGLPQTIQLPTNGTTLSGNILDDGLPNNTITQTWSQVSGPSNVTFGSVNKITTTVLFSQAGTYVLMLTASDGVLSNYDTVTVLVNPLNMAPIVNAGNDQTIFLPSFANLSGTVTDNGPVTLTWSKVSGSENYLIGRANNKDTLVGFSEEGTYVFQLEASDGALSSKDTVTITVVNLNTGKVNQAPQVNAGHDLTLMLPNQTADLSGLILDFDPVIIEWRKVSGPGSVTFGDERNKETTAYFSEIGTYEIELSANDGLVVSSDQIKVTLLGSPTTNDTGVKAEFLKFNPVMGPLEKEMVIRFNSKTENVFLTIYDRQGKEVRRIEGVGGEAKWDGRNSSSQVVASGTYLLVLNDTGKSISRTIVVVR